MKALTVRPPWSFLIGCGAKRIENRGRQTHYRGEVAIHAGLRMDMAALRHPALAKVATYANEVQGIGAGMLIVLGARTVYHPGHFVAVTNIVGCHFGGDCCGPFGEPERWHWELDGTEQLAEAVPAKGALGIWNVPPRTAEQVAAVQRVPSPIVSLSEVSA